MGNNVSKYVVLKILMTKNLTSIEVDKIVYSIKCFIYYGTNFIILSSLFLAVGLLNDFLIINFFFSISRWINGGFHSSNKLVCFTISLISYYLIIISTVLLLPINCRIVISLLSLVLIILIAPTGTTNRPKQKNFKTTTISLLIQLGFGYLIINNILPHQLVTITLLQMISIIILRKERYNV